MATRSCLPSLAQYKAGQTPSRNTLEMLNFSRQRGSAVLCCLHWNFMAYQRDLASAARRHWQAAEKLHVGNTPGHAPGNAAVAGYLFGLVGELALKELMRRGGMRPSSSRRDDPFYAHFPELKTLLRNQASGRLSQILLKLASDDSLFQHWDTAMRYAPTTDINEQWIAHWKESARSLIQHMEST